MGHAEFLKQEPGLSDSGREDIGQIEAAASRAAELTRQLLAFGRRQVLEPRPMALNEVVGDTMRMLGRVVGENIEVKVAMAPDLALTMADPTQVSQILINLVVNARDAMPQGGLLTIETRNAEVGTPSFGQHLDAPPGSYVMLGVTDNGVGIAPGASAPDLRAVLHHQGTGPRHRARPVDRVRHRGADRRLDLGVQRTGAREHVLRVLPPDGG